MSGPPATLPDALAAAIRWDERGLVPVACVDDARGALLMQAYASAEALATTLASGQATFWSRSRAALWRKGETSGHVLAVREVRLDCDGDALLYVVTPHGPACHTGASSCFFRRIEPGASAPATASLGPADDGPVGAPAAVIERVYRTLEARKAALDPGTSYSASLLVKGWPTILGRIDDEVRELAAELPAGPETSIVAETADVLFHVLVGLVARGVEPTLVWRELARRFGTSGHVEKASRPPRATNS